MQVRQHHAPPNVRDWSCVDVATWLEQTLPEGMFQSSWAGSQGLLCDMGLSGSLMYTHVTGLAVSVQQLTSIEADINHWRIMSQGDLKRACFLMDSNSQSMQSGHTE